MSLTILILYLLILGVVSILSFRKGFQNIFRTENSLPWYLAGFSLFLINPDTINVLSKMGIAATDGYAGMWIFYTGVLGAGFLPIIFAPLWSRLRFMTDNQFILFRFSGKPARILHLFRAAYVGYLVVALFSAQVFIGMSKLLMVFTGCSYQESFLMIGIILILLIAKSSLQLKVRTDFLNGIIYLVAFAIGAWFVLKHFGGASSVYPKLNSGYRGYIRLFPEGIKNTSFETIPTLMVYFLVQWWSINVLDGAGPEAQRFMNARSPFQAFKAAFLPLILFSLVFLFHSFVIDTGILMIHESHELIPQINSTPDLEASFIQLYKQAMPGGLSTLVFLAFLIGFTSFLEAFINWGASFVTVDVFKTYLFGKKKDRFYSGLSYLVMLVIGISGMIIAWYNTHLLGLQKFIFSMGAGVGPVFILRWFWWRINAWSQFTAMLSSLIFAVGWDMAYQYSFTFHSIIDLQLENLNFSYFAFKLLCITVMVTLCWLLVTFLTPPDDLETLEKYVDQVKPGGFWPFKSSGKKTIKKQTLLLLLMYPVISISPFLIIWLFKFGSMPLAFGLTAGWLILLYMTVKQMSRIDN
jgi:SSS family solute:Na+ symporter